MRAVVMDINKKQMVIMKEDGTFEKVKMTEGASIGDEITLADAHVNWRKLNKYTGIAASIALVLFGSWQVYAYYTPYGYVNIDINPSIELGFNKYERIISTKGINGDGYKVLSKTPNIKHSRIEDATRSIVETASEDNYIKNNQDNNILFSIYMPNRERVQVINTKINSSVLQYLKSSGKKAELINEIVSKEDLDKAGLQNISVGKLKLYEKAKAVDPNVTIDDIKNKSVKDIIKMIRTAKKVNRENDNSSNGNKTNFKKDDKVVDNSGNSEFEGSAGVTHLNNTKLGNEDNKDIIKSEEMDLKEIRKSEHELKKDSKNTLRMFDDSHRTDKQKNDKKD